MFSSTSDLSDRVQLVFEDASKSVLKHDPKATNVELVSRGQGFTPYLRNFDYLSNSDSPSTWKRDDSQNENIELILLACGLSGEEASKAQFGEVAQVYNAGDQRDRKSKAIFDPKFTVDTLVGIGLSDIVLQKYANAKIQEGAKINSNYKWTSRDTYITEFSFDNREPFLRVEKNLEFDAHRNGDNLVMIVKSYLSTGQEEAVSATETYFRTYNIESENVLGTPERRVPGCIANVDVRTVLIPREVHPGNDQLSYDVFIEGTADAILSRGLLATLQYALSTLDANDILSINPSAITDYLSLRNVLTSGRNDGLASVLDTVQLQIKNLLEIPINEKDQISGEEAIIVNKVANKEKVAMLLSGGVDSSVALNLLVRQGYDVTAFYLKIWLEDELAHLGQCPWEDDYRVCTEVCEQAGVQLESISLQQEYKEKVLSYTINEAKSGRTPNPDIMCNSRVKFGCFYDAISTRDFDFVATGHYAQLHKTDSSEGTVKKLLRAPDPVKDQSYFLAALTREQLGRVIFPIGHLEKSEVRDLASDYDLPNKNRPDSQGLCFLGKVRFDEFLSNYLGTDPGDIIDAETHEVIGKHNGIWFHTVGQRKGIGKVLFPKATSRGPWYVVAKDTSQKLIIASNQYEEDKFDSTRKEFFVEEIKWINSAPLMDANLSTRVSMKIRHGPTIVEGTIQLNDEDNLTLGKIVLDGKDGGLAPGQFVAFYDGIECLGSAVISEKHWLDFLQFYSDNV